uniref:nucleotide sugar dehydrogenase n=1 Tax=Altererythrobacter segetis TaxID=1104773 RepID=UPI00311A9DC4
MIVVVGLGYVGLPLAVALAEHFTTIGFDIDTSRIEELTNGHDRTCELPSERILQSSLRLTSDVAAANGANIYIITVPTPVDADNKPDLRPVMAASRTIAGMIDPEKLAIVVYESTVYPGVTEEVCGPIIEAEGGLRRGENFFLGYSPERINPGDREHTVDRIVKVVAGENETVTEELARVYSRVTSAGVFRAVSIKTAEAAKVIENAQRDINIAFMNEVARIFHKLGLSVWDVLEAARTKWNFLKFEPGLVGGHCIGVDPYYLSHLAQMIGHEPKVILAGRETNDSMGSWVAAEMDGGLGGKPSRILVLGITFKENVPDVRNSKVIDIVRALRERGHDVAVHDPLADPTETMAEYGIALSADALEQSYDAVLGAVAHDEYRALGLSELDRLLANGGLLADLKGIWRHTEVSASTTRWNL